MKLQKYILGAVVAVMSVMFVSCDKDNVVATYTPYTDNVTFMSKKAANILTKDASCEIPIRVVRATKGTACEAKYSIEVSEEGIFTDLNKGVVSFKEDETVAYINLKADNLYPGETYEATITFADEVIAKTDTCLNASVVSTTVVIGRDFVWEKAGTCTFVDYTFSEGAYTEGVVIENATGTNQYRVIEPWKSVFGPLPDGFDSDSGFKFTYNDDSSIDFIVGADGETLVDLDKGAYTFNWVADYVGSYCIIEQEGNDYYAEMLGTVDGEGYYTGFAFEFIWDEGWPGVKR